MARDAAARTIPAAPPDPRAWFVFAAMALPLFALSLDLNGVGTVLAPIQSDFDVHDGAIGWVVNASSLMFGASLLLVGRVAPRIGNRRLVLTGVAIVAVASIVCGTASNLEVLLLGRVAQGAGGVLTFTTSLAVIDAAFDARRRAAAIGAWGMVNGAGGALGPLIGGALTSWWSWRGFFLLNVPLCVVALPIIARLTPPDQVHAEAPGSPGSPGSSVPWGPLVALGVGLVAVTSGFQFSATYGWVAPATLAAFAAGIALLATVAVRQRRGAVPVVSAEVTGSPHFRVASVAAFCSNWGFGVAIVFMGSYLQDVMDLSPLEAGIAFSGFSASCAVAGFLIARLTRTLGLPRALIPAMAVVVASLAAGAFLTESTPLAVVALGLAFAGFGQGLAFDLTTLASLEGLPDTAAGEASAVISTVRTLGLTIGIALSSVLNVSVAGGVSPADDARGVAAVATLAALVALIGLGRVLRASRTATTAPAPAAEGTGVDHAVA